LTSAGIVGQIGRPDEASGMKAIRIHRFGGPEVLVYEDAPRPEPGEGEVLIRVHAAAVNPADWKTRSGSGLAHRFRDRLPIGVGWDVSGVVEVLGKGNAPYRVGDKVYGFIRFPDVGAAYAEYVVAPASEIAHKPRALDHIAAAGVPLAGLTAWQALFGMAQLRAGQRVLIHAAAGGVGHFAVQFARWAGATVIGTASARNEAFLRELGADQAIDYCTVRFEEVVCEVDVVLDPIGGDTRQRSWQVLKRGGILVGLVDRTSADAAPQEGVRGKYMLAHPDGNQLAEIARLIDAGHVRPHIDAVYPLQKASKAHEHGQRGRTRGKVVLRVEKRETQ
jgi:NADPH:quinone reductase-like Zn-dependent oxidoreductase